MNRKKSEKKYDIRNVDIKTRFSVMLNNLLKSFISTSNIIKHLSESTSIKFEDINYIIKTRKEYNTNEERLFKRLYDYLRDEAKKEADLHLKRQNELMDKKVKIDINASKNTELYFNTELNSLKKILNRKYGGFRFFKNKKNYNNEYSIKFKELESILISKKENYMDYGSLRMIDIELFINESEHEIERRNYFKAFKLLSERAKKMSNKVERIRIEKESKLSASIYSDN